MTNPIPVIAIDGPSASGKGTVAQRVANTLNFHYLDSGALYRIVALAGQQQGISWQDEHALAQMAGTLAIQFAEGDIFLSGQRVSNEVRSEVMSRGASEVAVHPAVRQALMSLQVSFRQSPGLVADGRDMGTVVFPDASSKIFLTASASVRAERRYKQLIGKGLHANLHDILADIESRDKRDSERSAAPLRQSEDALLLDTSFLTVDQVVEAVLVRVANTLR